MVLQLSHFIHRSKHRSNVVSYGDPGSRLHKTILSQIKQIPEAAHCSRFPIPGWARVQPCPQRLFLLSETAHQVQNLLCPLGLVATIQRTCYETIYSLRAFIKQHLKSTVWGGYYPGTSSRDLSHYGSPGLSNLTSKGDCPSQLPKNESTATKPSQTGLDDWHSHYTDWVKGRSLWVGGSWGHQISHEELLGHLCYPWTVLSIAAEKLDLKAQASTSATDCSSKLQPPATKPASKAHLLCHRIGRSCSQPLPESEGAVAN